MPDCFTRRKFLQLSSLTAASMLVPSVYAQTSAPKGETLMSQAAVSSSVTAVPLSQANAIAVVQKEICSLGVYSLADGKSLAQLPLPEQSHELVITADNRHAFIAQYGVKKWLAPGIGGHVMTVVDMQQLKVINTIDLTPYHRLHGIRLDDKGRLFVLSETSSVLIRFDDPVNNDEPDAIIPVNGARSHYFVLNKAGDRAWVSDTLSGMAISVNTEDPTQPVHKVLNGKGPEGCCLSPDEKRFYIINRYGNAIKAYDATSMKLLQQAETQGESVRVVALKNGNLVVANSARKSLLIYSPELKFFKEIALSAAPTAITLTDNDERVITSTEDNKLTWVDIRQGKLLNTINTDKGADASVLFNHAV